MIRKVEHSTTDCKGSATAIMEEQTKHKSANKGIDDHSLRKLYRSVDLNVPFRHFLEIFMRVQCKNSGLTLKTTIRDTKLCTPQKTKIHIFFLCYD